MRRSRSGRTRSVAIGAACLAVAATALTSTAFADEPGAPRQVAVELTPVAASQGPTAGTAGPGDTVWIAERTGLVRVLEEQGGLGEPVLDITDDTGTDGEGGLVGIAFDDGFEHFYVSYTDLDGRNVLDEFAVENGQLQLDTRRTILTQEQQGPTHNAGDIHFGPDGMLYMSIGDGSFHVDGDPENDAQRLDTLLGKLIRLDLDSGDPYGIPPDNPFVDDPSARGEIWAYGLRNPWRFSFDAETGDLWLGDVGQSTREEVDRALATGVGGDNYGWARMEGTLPWSGQEPADHVPPVFEYDHDGARCSVTGGYVYRGGAIPELRGRYLFSDYCEGDIRALDIVDGDVVGETNLEVNGGSVVSFVQGPDLELYVLDIAGVVYRLDPA
jgi:glucose/arabinose dehydrogenase